MTKCIDIKLGNFNNKGDGLMLLAIIDHFKNSDNKLAVKPKIGDYYTRGKLGLYQKLSSTTYSGLKNYAAGLLINEDVRKEFGLVLENDVDLVLDASGYAYGDNWGERKIRNSLKYYKRVKENKGKIIFLPQTFGPFVKTKQVFIELCSTADLICARDKKSFQTLLDIGIDPGKIRQYPDFTREIQLAYTLNTEYRNPEANVYIIPNHRMLDELGEGTAYEYKNFLVEAATTIQNKYDKKVVFLFHEKEDYIRFTSLIPELANFPIFFHEDPLVLRTVISTCDFVISSRFHGILTSFSNNVPCIGTSWSYKFDELFSEYTLSEFLIKPNEKEKLFSLISNLFDPIKRKAVSNIIKDRGEHFQAKTNRMWSEIDKIINI